jgi:hypothetical protein
MRQVSVPQKLGDASAAVLRQKAHLQSLLVGHCVTRTNGVRYGANKVAEATEGLGQYSPGGWN